MGFSETPILRTTNHQEVLAGFIELSGARVVEVGCGTGMGPGALVRWLLSQGVDAVGVDSSEHLLDVARAADPEHADAYLHGVGQDLPFPDRSFDAVVLANSLHHIPHDEMVNALREARRVLRANGTMCVLEPISGGSNQEVLQIVDGETEVRADAQVALESAAGLGFEEIAELVYSAAVVVESGDALADGMIVMHPERAESMGEHRAEFLQRFDELAVPIEGGCMLDQHYQARVFRKGA